MRRVRGRALRPSARCFAVSSPGPALSVKSDYGGSGEALRMRQDASLLRHRARSTFWRLDIKINPGPNADPAKLRVYRRRNPSTAVN
jgi:hypothetical protein